MIVPAKLAERWTTRARRGALNTLKSLLEFRELVPEYRAENVLMQAYKEAAEYMLISDETLRDLMGKIRNYPEEKLIYWIENGVVFDHMEKANLLYEIAKRESPAELLDEAISVGGENGKTMTVQEMTAFALGVATGKGKKHIFHALPLFERLGKFPNRFGWDEAKTSEYSAWLDAGKRFFE